MEVSIIPPVLGIDLGGSKCALAVGDARGPLGPRLLRATEPSGDPERDLARLVEDARALLREARIEPAELAAVGVAAPGPIDPLRGAVVRPPNMPGWGEVPVARVLARALGRPVRLENDANAAALAEWRFGAGRGCSHLVYLTASTGMGAGLVLGGRLHRGHGWGAGELGHVCVEPDGALCACGQRGCLEAYAGGAAWTQRLRERTPDSSQVARLAGGKQCAAPEHVVAAARAGDAFARDEMDRFNEYLARGIAALVFVCAPEIVVLGTIPSRAGEELCIGPVRERVLRRVWPQHGRDLRIVASELGDELPYYAAICAALEGSEPTQD